MTINTNTSDKYLLSVNSSLIHLNSLNKLIIWLFTEISGGFVEGYTNEKKFGGSLISLEGTHN